MSDNKRLFAAFAEEHKELMLEYKHDCNYRWEHYEVPYYIQSPKPLYEYIADRLVECDNIYAGVKQEQVNRLSLEKEYSRKLADAQNRIKMLQQKCIHPITTGGDRKICEICGKIL